jgi:hypothetical protein
MKIAMLAVAALALVGQAASPPLYLINEAGVYGFIDAAGGRAVTLPAGLVQARPFAEGLAAVARRTAAGEHWGYVDEHGAIAIAPRFDRAGAFSEGLAAVVTGGRLGYIDKTGAFVIRPQFADGDRLEDAAFSQGLAAVTNARSQHGYVDRHGLPSIPFRYAAAAPFSGDRARAAVRPPGGALSIGFIDRSGAWIVPPRFSQARDYAEGVAAVVDGTHAAFIDRDGKTVVALEPRDLEPCTTGGERGIPGSFSEGLAAVRVGCLWGFIDRTGATAIPPGYADAGPFGGGLAPVNAGDAAQAKWGYINAHGGVVIAPQFSTAAPFSGALALVQIGGSDDEIVARAMLRGLEDDAANATIKAQAKANFHPGTVLQKPELAYVDATGRIVWHHSR